MNSLDASQVGEYVFDALSKKEPQWSISDIMGDAVADERCGVCRTKMGMMGSGYLVINRNISRFTIFRGRIYGAPRNWFRCTVQTRGSTFHSFQKLKMRFPTCVTASPQP